MISESEAPKKLSKNESIKEDSHFLRGTILEGLLTLPQVPSLQTILS